MRRNKILVITVALVAFVVLACGGVLAWYFLSPTEPYVCPDGEHHFGEWRTDARATCGTDGKKVAYCTKCGKQTGMEVCGNYR